MKQKIIDKKKYAFTSLHNFIDDFQDIIAEEVDNEAESFMHESEPQELQKSRQQKAVCFFVLFGLLFWCKISGHEA